jgi:hypothetical protein
MITRSKCSKGGQPGPAQWSPDLAPPMLPHQSMPQAKKTQLRAILLSLRFIADLFIKEVNDILIVIYYFSVQHSKETYQSMDTLNYMSSYLYSLKLNMYHG